jgi:hypothetical protein
MYERSGSLLLFAAARRILRDMHLLEDTDRLVPHKSQPIQRSHQDLLPKKLLCDLAPRRDLTLEDAHPPLLEFLMSLPPQVLQYLRSIRCVFPPLSTDSLVPGREVHSHWVQRITFISNNPQLSKLRLTLDMSASRGPSSETAYMSPQEILDMEHAMWVTYQRIVEPLVRTSLNRG